MTRQDPPADSPPPNGGESSPVSLSRREVLHGSRCPGIVAAASALPFTAATPAPGAGTGGAPADGTPEQIHLPGAVNTFPDMSETDAS